MNRHALHTAMLCAALSVTAHLAAQSGGSVTGRVLNSVTNSPIPHAIVTLRGADAGPVQTYVTQTGSDGRFTISDILPGNYVPIGSKSGFDQGHSQRVPKPSDTPPIAIQAGQATPPIDIRLTPQATISGRIIDGDGDPVRRANVQAQQYIYTGGKKELRTTANAMSDDRGQYRLFNLTAGKYWLLVAPTNRLLAMSLPMQPSGQPQQNAEPISGLAAAYYPGSPGFDHASELVVTPGAALENIDMRLSPERLFSIRGSLPQGEARQGLTVYATTLDPNAQRGGFQTRFYGDQFEVIGLPPGKYMVTEQQVSTPQHKVAAPLSGRQVVEIVDRDVEHIDFTLSPNATVHGLIKASDESLLKNNLNVSFQQSDMGRANSFSSARVAAGAFNITLAPGIYTVRVNGAQAYLQYLMDGSDRIPDFKIDTAHPPGNLTLVIANDFGKVEGTVTDEAGKPVYNAIVTLVPDAKTVDAQDRFRSAYTLANGSFSMTTAPPGQYRLFAWAGVDPGAPLDPDFLKPYLERGVAVKVEPNSKQSFDLKVIPGAPMN